jgi:hypothetical protein
MLKVPENTSRSFQNLDDLLHNLHREGTAFINFNGNKIPCIYINTQEYNKLISTTAGKKLAVDTTLNIIYDGNDVFVDIQMKFLNIGEEHNYLVYANNMIEFFEALSNTGLLAVVPDQYSKYADNTDYISSALTGSNVFVIQLPKKEAAERALQIINANMKKRHI